MADHLPGFQTSSARRRRWRPSVLQVATGFLLVIVGSLAILQRNRTEPAAPPLPESPATPVPSTTSTPSATATVLVERSSDWVVAQAPSSTPTQTPWPTMPPPSRPTLRPQPTPTPANSQCVEFRWSARQVFIPSAQVMVEIRAANRCRRDFGPLELWFEITGWRGGDRIQSVRGHPFDTLRKGGADDVTIGLPGSIDWYDEITVEILD